MIDIVSTSTGLSPIDEEKKELLDRVKNYEQFIYQLIDHSDIVRYNPRNNRVEVFVSEHNPFYIEIPHFFETMNIWKYGKEVAEMRLQEKNKND